MLVAFRRNGKHGVKATLVRAQQYTLVVIKCVKHEPPNPVPTSVNIWVALLQLP
jgi:hypothetical protein